jgi:hypothetical protein
MWWSKGENWRRAWNYNFEWTPDHFTREQLKPLMYTCDELATRCLDRLDEISPPLKRPDSKEMRPLLPPVTLQTSDKPPTPDPQPNDTTPPTPSPHHRDYYALLKTHHASDPLLSQLWTELTTVPDWVSAPQLVRGQAVFYRYAGPAIVGLTFQSLLGGMGGYRVAETLSRTGGFGVRVARRRLLETFQHVLLVTRDLDSLTPKSGEGWISSVRVRFLHASVRRRILQLAGNESGGGGRYYDVDAHGVPVSDLDCIGTIATFGATLVWVSFPRQGIYLSAAEKEDFIALWRYAAYLLGTPTEGFFDSVAHARAIMESLLVIEIDPSPTSRVLANNIIAALAARPPSFASEPFLAAETRWLNGDELSDALHVPRPGRWYTFLVGCQCVLFMVVCYSSRMVPAWDRRRIEGLKGKLHRIVLALAGGGEAAHEFKYVPGLDVDTTRGQGTEKGDGEIGGRGVERRSVRAFAVTGTAIAAVAWLALRYASGALQRVGLMGGQA